MKIEDVIRAAVGPYDYHCGGYGTPGSSGVGYISVLTLKTNLMKRSPHLTAGLEKIVGYDNAEASEAYLGQINMSIASSFCGPTGAIWGYDLARHEKLQTASPLWTVRRHDGTRIPVFSIDPLIEAGLRLFGTREAKRFPVMPGAHVICAAKWKVSVGPCYVWCAIALGIAENREVDASLFMDDAGEFEPSTSPERVRETIVRSVADSVLMIGMHQNICFREIFVGFSFIRLEENDVGCALFAAPYIVLAKKALPTDPESLAGMGLAEWEHLILKPK